MGVFFALDEGHTRVAADHVDFAQHTPAIAWGDGWTSPAHLAFQLHEPAGHFGDRIVTRDVEEAERQLAAHPDFLRVEVDGGHAFWANLRRLASVRSATTRPGVWDAGKAEAVFAGRSWFLLDGPGRDRLVAAWQALAP